MTTDRASSQIPEPIFGTDIRLSRTVANACIRFVEANKGTDQALVLSVLAVHLIAPLWAVTRIADDDPDRFSRLLCKIAGQIARGEHLMDVA